MSARGALEGRVAIVTGAGRGLGRAHALLLADEGAGVVVNDAGVAVDGSGGDPGPAQEVVDEITSRGGRAVLSTDDVGDWEGARNLVAIALDAFGDFHVLVNNAGILRDRFLVNMAEEEWDDVVRVHLKGHAAPLRWAAAYWRERTKSGHEVRASIVNTTSTSGLMGNPGQANYGAAKAGIAALTVIAAQELARYGVRVNAVAPMARTRLTEALPTLADVVRPPDEPGHFDVWDPGNVSPVVAWLATESCRLSGHVFLVHGGRVQRLVPWGAGESVEKDHRWTVAGLDAAWKADLRPTR